MAVVVQVARVELVVVMRVVVMMVVVEVVVRAVMIVRVSRLAAAAAAATAAAVGKRRGGVRRRRLQPFGRPRVRGLRPRRRLGLMDALPPSVVSLRRWVLVVLRLWPVCARLENERMTRTR